MNASAHVVEIFSGIQGEGPRVGERHIFLRLAGCNLACGYCDQPEARHAPRNAQVEITPGQRNFIRLPNPLSCDRAAAAALRLNRPAGLHKAIALTGGEPLMHPGFLKSLLRRMRGHGLKSLLETNGTRPAELRALLPLIDIVSMDFKLRSATGRPAPETAHREFLKMAVQSAREVYVKAVVTRATDGREIARAARIVAGVDRRVPLILQPVTPVRGCALKPPSAHQLLELQEAALRHLEDVRVISQTHKFMGQR